MGAAIKTYVITFSTCPNPNSTGVERPKMVTMIFKRLAIFVHFVHNAGKAGERSFRDPDRLVLFELDFEPRLFFALGHAEDNLVNFILRKRSGLAGRFRQIQSRAAWISPHARRDRLPTGAESMRSISTSTYPG